MSKFIWLFAIASLFMISLLAIIEVAVAETRYSDTPPPLVGQPLSPQLKNYLLNKRWYTENDCSKAMFGYVYENDEGSIYKVKAVAEFQPIEQAWETSVVNIRMINNKEFVMISFPSYPGRTVIRQKYYEIINNHKFSQKKLIDGIKKDSQNENNQWKIETHIISEFSDQDQIDNTYSYYRCK